MPTLTTSHFRSAIARWAQRVCLALMLGSVAVAPLTSTADDVDPLDELRQRLTALEQDNRDLRAALAQQSNSNSSITPLVAVVPPGPDELEETEEERRIGSLVQKYMARMNAQAAPSQSDDVQDMKINALESNMGGLMKKLNGATTALGTFTKDGMFMTSNDGNFKTHIGAVAQMDYVNINSGNTNFPAGSYGAGGNSMEGFQFRRLRLRGEGTMYQNIDYVAEVDLAFALQNVDPSTTAVPVTGLRNGNAAGPPTPSNSGNTINAIQATTVFATFKDIPLFGNIRVGQQQDWFSMEHIESARFLDFMERAPIMDAFSGPNNNGYMPGISSFSNSEDKSFGLQYGIYKNDAYDADYTYSFGNAWEYGGRVIWDPYYDEDSQGRYLVHTGLSGQYRTFNTELSAGQDGQNVRVRSRGDLRTGTTTLDPNFADTGNFFATGQALIDPEIAIQIGPVLLQAEYSAGQFSGAKATQTSTAYLNHNGNLFMSGGYCEALYFLTGENRDYNRVSGVFNRVIPKHNWKPAEGGYGAWQVGVRYDWLNLNSGQINGGIAQDCTAGLNWFLNPNLRFQLNYVCSWVNSTNNTLYPGGAGGGAAFPALSAFANGAKFTGADVVVNSIGTRLDFTY